MAQHCKVMAAHRRILSTLGNGPARRSLFGPVDREQLQVEYQAALVKDLEDASHRWGFDFTSHKPLESSDFQWEGVPGARVPQLYRSCRLGHRQARGQKAKERTAKRGRVEPPQSGKENIRHTPQKCTFNLETLEKTPEMHERAAMKRKQTNITDFYQAKRKVVGMPCKSGE